MHSLHIRLPKNFVLEERLERYASAIEPHPYAFAGRWAEACAPLVETPRQVAAPQGTHPSDLRDSTTFREVRLDLGCGKGSFLVEAARREPDVLFLGIDAEPICIAYAAQAVCEAHLTNALVIPGVAEKLESYFAPGELERIYLNFPTPHPRLRHAQERMTHAQQLLELRKVLAAKGELVFKTDSAPLFAYTKTQLPLAGFELTWESTDARADRPDDPSSGYEDKLTAQGAQVFALAATPTASLPSPQERATKQQTISQSLVDYLPDDLAHMSYVPHGMQATVANLANLEAKGGSRPRHAPSAKGSTKL